MSATSLTDWAVQLRPIDNVAVAARNIPPGTPISFAGEVLHPSMCGPRENIYTRLRANSPAPEHVRASGVLSQYPNVDGIIPIVHKQDCAMQYDGPDHRQLDRTLAGFANHANVGAYLLKRFARARSLSQPKSFLKRPLL